MTDWGYEAPPGLWPLFFALTGAVVGSFINVVIHRIPLMTAQKNNLSFNLFLPRSHCPHCGLTLRWQHTLPLASWLFLRGKCAYCGDKIAGIYPLVELFFTLFALLLSCVEQTVAASLFALLFVGFLVPLALIDLRHGLLPDMLTLPFLWAGLLYHALAVTSALADAIYGAVAGYVALWSLYWLFYFFTRREGLGYGDFKLLAALGAWLGWAMLPAVLLLAASLGILAVLAARLYRKKSLSGEIPFGPFLTAAGALCYFFPAVSAAPLFGFLN
ncbi:prepilin peptidase [Kalamiella sp. sgz302252]|uniref:prepilin peptidase n=1 Tax=Pantoea sp. sgz302252 TaxID=3341827 RepID=UPI0036D2ADCC